MCLSISNVYEVVVTMEIITVDRFEHWLGSDNGRDVCIEILLDLLNSDYTVEQMRQDILEEWYNTYYDEECMTIDELENLYHELKVRKDKGIGGEGIKDIQFRRYIKSLINKKKGK
jgi:hypothetical protein